VFLFLESLLFMCFVLWEITCFKAYLAKGGVVLCFVVFLALLSLVFSCQVGGFSVLFAKKKESYNQDPFLIYVYIILNICRKIQEEICKNPFYLFQYSYFYCHLKRKNILSVLYKGDTSIAIFFSLSSFIL